MMVQKKIVDHHGRVENVKLFDKDPTVYIKMAKEREEDKIKKEKEAEKAKQLAMANGEEIEETKDDPAAAQQEAEEDRGPDYVQYEKQGMTIYEIFGLYGKETKAECEDPEDETCRKELYYDFTPYNSKDPVLLSLMTAKKYN